MFKMYNVSVGEILTEEQAQQINGILNRSKSWLRYGPSCWLVWDANHTALEWMYLIRPVVPYSNLLVSAFSGDREESYASFSEEVWNWITGTSGGKPEEQRIALPSPET